MKGDPHPTKDHIARFVKPRDINKDGSISGWAFCLRKARPDERGLWVHWLEVLEEQTEYSKPDCVT